MTSTLATEQDEPVARTEAAEDAGPVRLFGAVRGRLWLIVALSLIGAVASVVSFIAIVELARTFWLALEGGPVDVGRASTVAGVAAAALAVSFAAAGSSGIVSHLADGDLQLDLRRRIVEHLRSLPLG